MTTTDPVLNIAQVEFSHELRHGDKFEAKVARVSAQLGARKLGYNVTAVAPGKRAFPFHNHHANEELFFILEGEGTLRFGARTLPVKPGDFIACPAGGPEVAHQLVNTGQTELRYLAVSTMLDTDIFQYPDSGKFGAVGGRSPGAKLQDARFAGFYLEKARLDYWDGE